MTAKARTAELAIKLLAEEPEGLGYSILIERLAAALPDIPVNTIKTWLRRSLLEIRECMGH